MSSSVQGNFVDQAWAANLPGFFKDNVKPALAGESFLIPRQNATVPSIVTRNTVGTVYDRGFIDKPVNRLETTRSVILNPSTYVKRLHPSDLTSGTGGIDNLSNLYRFGHPLPFADGEDFADHQFFARYLRDNGADPLTEGYAVKTIGEGGAGIAQAAAEDRANLAMRQRMMEEYASLSAEDKKRFGRPGETEFDRKERMRMLAEAAANAAAPQNATTTPAANAPAQDATQAGAPPAEIGATPEDPFAGIEIALGNRVTGQQLRDRGYTIRNISEVDPEYEGGQYIAYLSRGARTYASERDDLAPDQVNRAIFEQNRQVEDLYGDEIYPGRPVPVQDEDEGAGAQNNNGPNQGIVSADAAEIIDNVQRAGQAIGAAVEGATLALRGEIRDQLNEAAKNAGVSNSTYWAQQMRDQRDIKDLFHLMGARTSNVAAVYSNAYAATPYFVRRTQMGLDGNYSKRQAMSAPMRTASFEPRVEQVTSQGGDVFGTAEKASDPRMALFQGRRPGAATYLDPNLAAESGAFKQLEFHAGNNRFDGNIDGPSEQASLAIRNPTNARNMQGGVSREFVRPTVHNRQTSGVLGKNQRTPSATMTIANRSTTTNNPVAAFRGGAAPLR